MLTIAQLCVSIDDKPILNGVDLQVKPGTVHALMGPNGSGKSTLAAALMGHPRYQVKSGDMLLNGVSLVNLSPDKRAKQGIFLAFQHPLEIPGVRVATFLKEAHRAMTGLQLSVGEFNTLLQEKMSLLNLDPVFANRNLNEGFSGGEKKRLEILQMLILNPSLVILDEIDSGLDIDALNDVARAIAQAQQLNPTMSIIMITHYQRILNVVRPDHVHILHNGVIVKSGDATLAHELEHKGYHGSFTN